MKSTNHIGIPVTIQGYVDSRGHSVFAVKLLFDNKSFRMRRAAGRTRIGRLRLKFLPFERGGYCLPVVSNQVFGAVA